MTREEEFGFLKDQANMLNGQIEQIEDRIRQLGAVEK